MHKRGRVAGSKASRPGGRGVSLVYTAKNQYRKFSKNIPKKGIHIPRKELRGHSANFHIHVSVSDLYIPTMDLPILLQEICGMILGIYKSLTDT
jgi:hypothetical protein